MVVPPYSVQCVFDLKDHRTEGADGGQVCATLNRLVVRVVNEACICSVLPIEATEDQDGCWTNLIGHSQVTRHPRLLVANIDRLPDILLDIVGFTNVRYLLGGEFNPATEHVNELGVENATGSRVPGNIKLCHSYPLINANVVVFTSFVKILGVVATNDIDAVFIGLVYGCEI